MSPAPYFTAAETSRRKLVELEAPIVHADGNVYQDTDFVVSPRFKLTSVCAALYAHEGHAPISIRNCSFRTPYQSWDPVWAKEPIWTQFSGVRLAAPKGLVLDGLHVEGFPNAAFTAHGIEGATIKRVSATRCMMGLNVGWRSRGVALDYLRVWDTWGPAPGMLPGFGSSPSLRHPGRFTGGDGVAAYLDDSVLRYLEFSGDMWTGLKLCRSKRVSMFKVVTPSLMVQGTQLRHANVDGSTDGTEAIGIRGLYLDKRIGGSAASDGANGMQVSWHVTGLDVRDFALFAGGKGGHGVQLWGDVSAVFRDGIFEGWNGTRGGAPAYAMEIGDGSTLNADFESANQFFAQDRILRRAG